MQRWLASFQSLVPLLSCFLACFFILQLSFLFQFSPNAWFLAIFISLAYLLFGLGSIAVGSATLLHLSPPKWHGTLRNILFGLFYLGLIGTLICDQYLIITHERLDEAFYLFNWQEIWMIADPLHRLSPLMILGLIGLLILPFVFIKKLKPYSISHRNILGILLIFNLLYLLNPNDSIEQISENRLVYFLEKSVLHLFETKDEHKVNPIEFKGLNRAFLGNHKVINPEFPLLHEWNEPSTLANELRITSNRKPPHIKIIIVESMSSDLFGQRGNNTGCLMPFMDSMSRKSIYFPNGFSTYQRTHNVLPAVLASVPNTIDGNVFQQLPFPRHYSMMNLLSRGYHTQFYCGVPLEYLNMIGLMSYYKTNYIVKNWNKTHKQHRDAIGNAWGFPDEDLFQQAQYDERNQLKSVKKPTLKVYLTISTHDPFIYPNKERWSQFVLEKSKRIKNQSLKKMVASQASSFGSFSYTDSVLSAFFAKERLNASYENTIYFITGDHGSELYTRNALSKYNVPLLIFSPLIKKPKTAQTIVSHNDFAPTILNYLREAYRVRIPDTIPFIGNEIKIVNRFKANRCLVFTTNKLRTNDLMINKSIWIGGKSYSLDSSMHIFPKALKKVNWVKKQLIAYQALSRYTNIQNKIVDSIAFTSWTNNQLQFVLRKKTTPKSIKLSQIMTRIGNYYISKKDKTIRIEIRGWLSHNKAILIKKLPVLCINSERKRYLSKKWTVFNNIKSRIEGKLPWNAKNEIVYSIEFSPKDISRWAKGGQVYLYLRNEEEENIKFRKLSIKFYSHR
ncbi:MAG: hypothetical protein RL365_295 [Bacteroidota bacterium]|jgi:phosphoglycerol transferase MdoB-like AlkP superfamily enzyme